MKIEEKLFPTRYINQASAMPCSLYVLNVNANFDLIYLFLFAFLFACDNAFEDKAFEKQGEVYHVIKEPVVDSLNLAPPALFYGQHNFVVYPNGKTYYHNKFDDYGWCGTGVDTSNPGFINLLPSDLVELTDDNLVSVNKGRFDVSTFK